MEITLSLSSQVLAHDDLHCCYRVVPGWHCVVRDAAGTARDYDRVRLGPLGGVVAVYTTNLNGWCWKRVDGWRLCVLPEFATRAA